MRRMAFLVVVLVLGSCASVQEFTKPDGSRALLISCNSIYQDMVVCYVKAEEVCGGPFQVVDSSVRPVNSEVFRNLEVICSDQKK